MKYMKTSHVPRETEENLELSTTLDNDGNTTDQSEKLDPVPRKRQKKTISQKEEHGVAVQMMQKPSDEYQIFGDFVASELRGLKKDENKRKLKRLIQQAILKVTEEDDQANNDKILLSTVTTESATKSSEQLFTTPPHLFSTSDDEEDIPTQSLISAIQAYETESQAK